MIKVNDDYIIEIDAFNYTVKRDLHKKTLKKDKILDEEIEVNLYRTVGYYGDLTSAIKGVITDMNRLKLSSGVHTLKEAVDIVLENNRRVSDLLEKALEV
jgi:putative transposon-encoded protein